MTIDELLRTGLNHYNQGEVLEAENCFREALSRDKDNIHALNLLGMVYINTNRPSESVSLIERAIILNPNDHKAHGNLGTAFQRLGDLSSAEDHFMLALRLQPNNPSVLNNLGLVFKEMRRYSEAVKSFEKALKLNYAFSSCWINLSQALVDWGKFDHALQAITEVVRHEPNNSDAQHQLAEVYRKKFCLNEAVAAYKKSLSINDDLPDSFIGMASTYRQMDDTNSALELLNRAINKFPDNPQVHSELGVLYEQIGDRERAAKSFKKSIELAPNIITPYYLLSQLKGRNTSDQELEAMELLREKIQDNPSEVFGEIEHLHYALAESYDKRGRYDEAFNSWVVANDIRANKTAYSPKNRSLQQKESLKINREMIHKFSGIERAKTTPKIVFVVGMPRSGTSLTDQILASHSKVCSLGEVSYAEKLAMQATNLVGMELPKGLVNLTSKHLDILRDGYIDNIHNKYLDADIILDKTPMNFQYLGLLAVVFPDAQFIHCHRNPIDNCFSIYKLPFAEDQDYAHSLLALSHKYNLYRDMMKEWKTIYQEKILDVCYEDTVTDIESQAKRMIGFLGLNFEDEMLEFYKSERMVRTPSASQVRQPIYTSSVDAWKKYEKHLTPLINQLSDFCT